MSREERLAGLKTTNKIVAVSLITLQVLACGADNNEREESESQTPFVTAASLGEQSVQSNAEYLASDQYAAADIALGERLAMQCRACHSLESGGSHLLGPALHGFIGNQAGTASGFGYSKVMRDSGFTWTPESLDGWLANPAAFLPGNMMAMMGIRDAAQRQAVIAYLLQTTATESTE